MASHCLTTRRNNKSQHRVVGCTGSEQVIDQIAPTNPYGAPVAYLQTKNLPKGGIKNRDYTYTTSMTVTIIRSKSCFFAINSQKKERMKITGLASNITVAAFGEEKTIIRQRRGAKVMDAREVLMELSAGWASFDALDLDDSSIASEEDNLKEPSERVVAEPSQKQRTSGETPKKSKKKKKKWRWPSKKSTDMERLWGEVSSDLTLAPTSGEFSLADSEGHPLHPDPTFGEVLPSYSNGQQLCLVSTLGVFSLADSGGQQQLNSYQLHIRRLEEKYRS